MMKKMKRIVAVLLTGVMALTMLTACGSGKFIERNAKLEGAVSLLMETLFSAQSLETNTFENDAVDSIIEKYAREISKNPSDYIAAYEASLVDEDDEASKLYSELKEKFISEYAAAIGKEKSTATMILSNGSMSADELIKQAAQLLGSSSSYANGSKTTISYCLRTYHATNPANSSDSAWVIFLVAYGE